MHGQTNRLHGVIKCLTEGFVMTIILIECVLMLCKDENVMRSRAVDENVI